MNETAPVAQNQVLIHDVEEKPKTDQKMIKKIITIAIIVALGTATGYFLSSSNLGQSVTSDKGIGIWCLASNSMA